MNKKIKNLIIILYLIIFFNESIYAITGNYISHYWDFGFEFALLYSGNHKMLQFEMNQLYAHLCLSLFLSIIYCITKIQKKIQLLTSSVIIIFIIVVIFYIHPQICSCQCCNL